MLFLLLILVLLTIICVVDTASVPSTNQVLNFIVAGSLRGYNNTIEPTITDDLIRKAGFEPERHNVVTEDGYILRLTRIRTAKEGPPVLFVHGLGVASDMYVKRGRNVDLAFILADDGFDVWLADQRGNIFNRKHETLKVSDKKFWDFSFHEIGIYDLPAIINTVLSHSKYPKLFYIGHSLGTAVFNVMASMVPEMNNYIQTSILLSPIAFPPKGKIKAHLAEVFKQSDQIYNYLNNLSVYDILPKTKYLENFIRNTCFSPLQSFCLNFFDVLYGEHRSNVNKTEMIECMSTSWSGTSIKNVFHMAKVYKTGEFKQFDYGEAGNLVKYGQRTPPYYYLDRVSAPVVLIYSDNDNLLDEQSVQKLANLLPNVIYQENIRDYNHIDFLLGLDVKTVLYEKIVNMLHRLKM